MDVVYQQIYLIEINSTVKKKIKFVKLKNKPEIQIDVVVYENYDLALT